MSHSSSRRARTGAVALLALLSSALPAGAQQSVEVVPYTGYYVPFSDFGSTRRTPGPGVPDIASTFRENLGVLLGLKGRIDWNDNLGTELTASWTRTGWTETLKPADPNLYVVGYSVPGSVLQTQLRATYRPVRSNLYLLGGATWTRRGGDAWNADLWNKQFADGTTKYNSSNVGAVIGTGFRAAASPRLRFDVTAELHLASVDKVASGFVLRGRDPLKSRSFQQDFVLTVGVPLRLWQR